MRYSRNWEQNTMLEKGRVCMKDREELLKEIALMLERQDMLSKLTENQCLDEYGCKQSIVFSIIQYQLHVQCPMS